MERLKELITQLKEQFDRKADAALMLDTTRLLEAELQQLANQPQSARVMPTKITVMMPSASKMYAGQQNGQPAPQTAPQTQGEPRKDIANQRNGVYPEHPLPPLANPLPLANPQPLANPPVNAPVPVSVTAEGPDARYMPPAVPAPAAAPAPGEAVQTAAQAPAATATLEKLQDRGTWPFNPLADKPTDRFTLSQRSREVNDVIALNGSASLNDKLKSEVTDLKSALNDTPVRDLKKAIGVNDRYVFINQLFRGDEVMYERSIKTINGFRILPEAEYWMERELKVKLGWDENRETTRHFYQLVKRRFS
ncbi:MAG TPA: hypothetical protein VNW04_13335 [Puia sp.]|jgi:hypothetical protein|nr:hypothetical protein [Puia sp.]